ncbi:hypothetical protein D1AOALGA4SA_10467, partial [Olavius algarvensis Delta 1 endosymbiont]
MLPQDYYHRVFNGLENCFQHY